jgi:hypothetical protein
MRNEDHMQTSRLFTFLRQRAVGSSLAKLKEGKSKLENGLLAQSDYERMKGDPEVSFSLFWELSVHCDDPQHGKSYGRCRDRFIVELAEKQSLEVQEMIIGQEFTDTFSGLDYAKDSVDTVRMKVTASFNRLVKGSGKVEHPIKPGFQITHVEKVVRLSSAQAPLVVTFTGVDEDSDEFIGSTDAGLKPTGNTNFNGKGSAASASGLGARGAPAVAVAGAGSGSENVPQPSTLTCCFKREPLIKDVIVMRILSLISVWLTDAKVDVDLIVYRVLPTGLNEGFIEFVSDATTLQEIYTSGSDASTSKGADIQKWIRTHNRGAEAKAQSTFARSLATYTVIMFLLGAGDRHDENVMIRKDGCFFHVDYGWLLGKDPKKWLVSGIGDLMPFSGKYIEAMGGEDSVYHQEFQACATQVYQILRKEARVILSLLLHLVDDKDDIKQLEADYKKRFSVGIDDGDAARYLHMFLASGHWKQDAVSAIHQTSGARCSSLSISPPPLATKLFGDPYVRCAGVDGIFHSRMS